MVISEQGAIAPGPSWRPQEVSLFLRRAVTSPAWLHRQDLEKQAGGDNKGTQPRPAPAGSDMDPAPASARHQGLGFYSCARHHQSSSDQHPWPLESSSFKKHLLSVFSTPSTFPINRTALFTMGKRERKEGTKSTEAGVGHGPSVLGRRGQRAGQASWASGCESQASSGGDVSQAGRRSGLVLAAPEVWVMGLGCHHSSAAGYPIPREAVVTVSD